MAYGRQKDDNENKGRKGKGPKKMKVKKESARQERKNLLKENPVINKSDDNENIGRGGKGPKPMSRTRRVKASVMQLKDGLVSRFQSSTPKVGKNELMEPVMKELTSPVAKAGLTGIEFMDDSKKKIKAKKKVETKLTKGQKRSYELRDAHS